jgi:hypothetical protein
MSLFESIAIIGLVLFYLGMSLTQLVYWALAALVLQATFGMPKIAEYLQELRQP